MFCIIQCSHRVWNPSLSLNLNPSPAVEISHYEVKFEIHFLCPFYISLHSEPGWNWPVISVRTWDWVDSWNEYMVRSWPPVAPDRTSVLECIGWYHVSIQQTFPVLFSPVLQIKMRFFSLSFSLFLCSGIFHQWPQRVVTGNWRTKLLIGGSQSQLIYLLRWGQDFRKWQIWLSSR